MDVHQHTHTERKKWTHYFWEFLMLFLAVFCGFLAEYQLEHKIEKNRERQLLLNSPSPGNYAKDIYFFAVTAGRTNNIRFIPNDGTMQQLKNSGGLRLIRKHHVADSIAKYDVTVRFLSMQNELEESLINDYRETASNIFDARIFDQMLDSNNNVSKILKEDPKLLAFTQKELQRWNYRMYAMKGLNKAIKRDARTFLQQAVNFLNTLRNEYPIE